MTQHLCPWCGQEISVKYVWKSTFMRIDSVNSLDEDGQCFICPHCNREVATVIQAGFLFVIILSVYCIYRFREVIFAFDSLIGWVFFISLIIMDISVIFISLLYPYRRYQERYSPLELYEVDINIKWKGILAGGVIYPEKSILEDVVLCCEDTEAQYFDISNFKWLDFKECNCKARFLPCTPIVEIKRDDKMKIQYKGSCIGIATII